MTYFRLLATCNGLPPWWKWRNFSPREVSCKHCGEIWQGDSTVPPDWFTEAMDTLQLLRTQWGKPIIINSGHRCQKHNRAVGGVANSKHYTHIAFDCRVPEEEQWKFCYLAANAGFKYARQYKDRGFVHIDIFERSGRDWTHEAS